MSNFFRKVIIEKEKKKKKKKQTNKNILPFKSSKKMVRESQVPYIIIYSPFIKILSISNLIKK